MAVSDKQISQESSPRYDVLLLISVVHEFNFPHVVRTWVSNVGQQEYSRAVIWSVSGGGVAIGNRGAQKKVIESLEKRGIPVVLDETFAMPSNFFYRVKHPVDAMELVAYPVMVRDALTRLLNGERYRPKIPLFDQVVTWCFRNSWKRTHRFGEAIVVSPTCTACGDCIHTCPVDNIRLNEETGNPVFSDACVFCLGCLYVCRYSALQAGRDKYALLKDGYDLAETEKRPFDHGEWGHVETLCRGYLYSGIKPYLIKARSLLFPEEYPLEK